MAAFQHIPTGIQQKFWVTKEAADGYNSYTAVAAADAVPLIELSIQPKKEFLKSRERRGTASLTNEVAGAAGGTWSAKAYLAPEGGTVTNAPDISEILEAAFGYTNNSTDRSYLVGSSGTEKTTPLSLQFVRTAGPGLYERIMGCWVEQVDIEISRDIPTISFSGGFATHTYASSAYTAGTISSSGAVVTVDAGHIDKFKENSFIQFNEGGTVENNSGNGYKVGTVTKAANTFAISPGATQEITDNSTIEAFHSLAQTFTATNVPISGAGSGLTMNSKTAGFISFKCSIKTGIKGLEEANSTVPTHLVLGDREVTGEISTYALAEDVDSDEGVMRFWGGAFDGDTMAISARAGEDTTKKRAVVNIPKARVEVSPIEIPESEEAVINFAFTALRSAANGDEITLDFT